MSVNILEAINLLKSYRVEEDPVKAKEMHQVLVYSLISSTDLSKPADLSSEETQGVTFSLDNNLHELFQDLADGQKGVVGWKTEFLNDATMSQIIREIDVNSMEQKDELMIEEPSFKEVLEILFDYRNTQEKEPLTNLHLILIRLLLEHRVMNTEGTTAGAISTPVHFKMDEDLYALFNNMSENKETSWKRNFLNRAVFNKILEVIEENRFK